jgi:protein-S-isoprenylcysteine O-methyltransferase Ste14
MVYTGAEVAQRFDSIAAAVFGAVMVCWIVFAAIFIFRKKPPREKETKRETRSYWGIGLVSVGFALVWIRPRPYFSPIVAMPRSAEILVAAVTVILAVASVALCMAAVQTLGKQWTYRARVIEGHELITAGPYGFVRNPIYLAMFGVLVASGLAIGRWPLLVAGATVFLAGTFIRIHSEEKLLREAFGQAFEKYAQRVPAFIPKLF